MAEDEGAAGASCSSGGNGRSRRCSTGGIGMNAIDGLHIGSTLMPSVVAEIGGLDLFAWVDDACSSSPRSSPRFWPPCGPSGSARGSNYLIAAQTMSALGSLDLRPRRQSMPITAASAAPCRALAAGLLADALTYAMVRVGASPSSSGPAAFALALGIWGIATLVGPRSAASSPSSASGAGPSSSCVPFAVLLALLSLRVKVRAGAAGEAGVMNHSAAPPDSGLMIVVRAGDLHRRRRRPHDLVRRRLR